MEVWNIIKIKSVKGMWQSISTILSTFDEETAKRNFFVLMVIGEVSIDGTCVVVKDGIGEIIYKLSSSPLVLNANDCTKDMDDLYCAYKELLVSRLKQWGEKEVSKMGDEIYRLDITDMDYHIESNGLHLIEEVILQVNGNKEYISFNLDNGQYTTLNNHVFVHMENLVSFISQLTEFMSKKLKNKNNKKL